MTTEMPPQNITESLELGSILHAPKESSTFIIFGASGDLTKRKLIPALYNLACHKLLPPDFSVIGFAVTPMDDQSFRETVKQFLMQSKEANPYDARIWDEFAKHLYYITADFLAPEGYVTLKQRLEEIEGRNDNPDNRLYYLATPPSLFPEIINRLGSNNLVTPEAKANAHNGWTRIIIEKPFGRDLESARLLNTNIHNVFKEEQIYRIDHYLGKETVQNILAFRFANSHHRADLEPSLCGSRSDHGGRKLSASKHRGGYYEESGALRDMFQNHLLQVLATVGMDPPVKYGGASVRDRKADVLRAIVPVNPENLAQTAIRGQYGAGVVDGKTVQGYRQELNVNPESKNRNFCRDENWFIDSWRWADVPFYLRSGKRMASKVTEIVIQFKRVPHLFFQLGAEDQMEPNLLTIRVQPDEGISLRFGAKVPGPEMHLRQVQMNFSYADAFKVETGKPPTKTLLLDAMEGDATLFNRADAVELAWEVVEPILDIWSATKPFQPFPNYASGSWGPLAADQLMTNDGRCWHNEISAPAKANVAVNMSGEIISGTRRGGGNPESGQQWRQAGTCPQFGMIPTYFINSHAQQNLICCA